MSAAVEVMKAATVSFPSQAWFQQLADQMNANRARQEQLGYVDCVAQFTVLDGGPGGAPLAYRVTFEEFSAIAVDEVPTRELGVADFALEGDYATWKEMIENIVDGHGRPDLEHSLNRLSHMGTPMKLVSTDPVQADCYFRFNQSLQEFVNACARFTTVFGR
jgi:hypothetical protein